MHTNSAVSFLKEDEIQQLKSHYTQASNRLLLLDYDGTLVSFASLPDQAKPSGQTLQTLEQLTKDSANTIYIISGRNSNKLEEWLGHLPLHIIAEHGAMAKALGCDWEHTPAAVTEWIPEIKNQLETVSATCAGTFVESKKFSVAWHYRNAQCTDIDAIAEKLFRDLNERLEALPIQVIKGHKVIEVRNKGVNKGAATQNLLKETDYDFILCCGDDTTDEDMFIHLQNIENARCIKVGDEPTAAQYRVQNVPDVLNLLGDLSASEKQ